MYKNEYILGLIGSILATMFAVFSLLGCIVAAFFLNYFTPYINDIISNAGVPYHYDITGILGAVPGLIIIVVIILFVFAAASFILGFIGASRLNKNDKSGGVLLIVAGVLSFITICEFIPFILFLVGGIMALSKKQPV